TVGDLIYRVGNVTHTELYVDPHYEKKSLMILGRNESAPAGDLLQAVSFCLTATYRKVGQAYVLTDDLYGVGARRQIWIMFERRAQAMLEQALDAADEKLYSQYQPTNLPILDSSLAWTSNQSEQAVKTPSALGLTHLKLTLAQLSTQQQSEAHRLEDIMKRGKSQGMDLAPNSEILLSSDVSLELLLPHLDAPATISSGASVFFNCVVRASQEKSQNDDKTSSHPMLHLTVSDALHQFPKRAVALRLDRRDDIKSIVIAIKKLDFNQLWVDVSSAPHDSQEELLTEVISEGTASGIAVYPIINLFRNQDFPSSSRDLTILEADSKKTSAPDLPAWANPASVQQDVSRQIQQYVKCVGCSGVVWTNTAPPGYHDIPGTSIEPMTALGYTKDMRLAFLRRWHADPIDIDPTFPISSRVNTSLPNFDDFSNNLSGKLVQCLSDFRAQVLQTSLEETWEAVYGGNENRSLEVLMEQQSAPFGGDWYGVWKGPEVAKPDELLAASAASKEEALIKIQVGDERAQRALPITLQRLAVRKKWTGIVIDAGDAVSTLRFLSNAKDDIK
ncbi:MAG: hypothetical protein JWQ02_349, partial [Capsulimonas sp.]|nr:hypothetical protein [Capsulimonas sp.]